MSGIPVIDYRAMEKVLHRLGFVAIRQRGSHVFFRHADGRYTTVPVHPGRDLSRPLIREILREIEIAPAEFRAMLRNR